MNRSDFLKRSALGLGVVAALPLLPLVPGVPKGVKPDGKITGARIYQRDGDEWKLLWEQKLREHKMDVERFWLDPHWRKEQVKILEERHASKT